MAHPLLQNFRGTAEEITRLANKLIEDWHYQPDKHANYEKAFELLLRPLLEGNDNEPWSGQRIHDVTGVNKSTISNMRIALVMLELLPYEEDEFSTQEIRNIWAALKDPANKDRSYAAIAADPANNWKEVTVLYYARVGRFAGEVPSRDEARSRPISDLMPVKVAYIGRAAMPESELKPEQYDQISAELLKATDDDGTFQDCSILHIASRLGVSASIVKEVRIGLVALKKLPERQPIDRAQIHRMWEVLKQDKTTTMPELAKRNGWKLQSLQRDSIIGRLAGEVEARVERQKRHELPRVLKLMTETGCTTAQAARELGLNEQTVRSWTKNIEGFRQQDQIQASMTKMLGLIIDDPTINNVELGKALGVSPNAVADYNKRLVAQLKASRDDKDKVKLRVVLARTARPPSKSREYAKRKPTQGDG